LVPDVTLIAFPIPVATARGGGAFSSRESAVVSPQENGLDSDVLSEFRRKPEFSPLMAAVLDRCSQVRNQCPRKNLLIL
jgi:hypothetical protein